MRVAGRGRAIREEGQRKNTYWTFWRLRVGKKRVGKQKSGRGCEFFEIIGKLWLLLLSLLLLLLLLLFLRVHGQMVEVLDLMKRAIRG